MADGWVWAAVGLLLALLAIRAWVVETGHATLGRTPVRVKVLTGACALATVLVAGTVAVDGGARLVWLVLHPAEAQAIEDAERAAADAAADAATAPPVPTAAPQAPAGTPVPPPSVPQPSVQRAPVEPPSVQPRQPAPAGQLVPPAGP